jgi:hypothetical protein
MHRKCRKKHRFNNPRVNEDKLLSKPNRAYSCKAAALSLHAPLWKSFFQRGISGLTVNLSKNHIVYKDNSGQVWQYNPYLTINFVILKLFFYVVNKIYKKIKKIFKF